MASSIDQETMMVLEQCRVEDDKVFLPETQLDRKLYQKVNKVLEALGGKWNRKAKAHLFSDDPADALDSAMLTGSYVRLNQELQFFPTPNEIITQMIDYAEKTAKRSLVGMTVLEPSAGDGAIVKRLVEHGCSVICCEQHPPFREKLEKINGVTLLRETDFLKVDPNMIQVDAVVANPPFTKQQDVDHVRHMLRFLHLGSPLVSIMSSGVIFRETSKTKAFKDALAFHKHKFYDLPANSFKASGTGVNTVMLVAEGPAK